MDPVTQTLYAELLDRLRLRDAHRTIGNAPGTFVTKNISGKPYYYFQYSNPGGAIRQVYVGAKTAALEAILHRFREERFSQKDERMAIERLCAQLRAGEILVTEHAAARVLEGLAESGLFRSGGLLIGTHAFTVLGNLLGVRWVGQALRTQDIDVAVPPLTIVLPGEKTSMPDVLEKLEMGFLPVPPLDPRHPSASFKVRGHPMRVDVLTPQKGKEIKPVFLPQFNTEAYALPYLDYIMEESVEGAVVNGGGRLVKVPAPSRFALHKLMISQSRGGADLIRSDKDILQSAQVLSVLAERRPGDISLAWDSLSHRGKNWVKMARNGLRSFSRQFPIEHHRILKAAPFFA
ncbi:MAG: nucleotidyltransferase domain-containing protein [Elusimicrobia bacterium]|nr:nucleotidyltransferase domain-containing protein [Elusimicrobiota bacterium]